MKGAPGTASLVAESVLETASWVASFPRLWQGSSQRRLHCRDLEQLLGFKSTLRGITWNHSRHY